MAHFCGSCGNPLTDNQRFCPNCGAAVNNSGPVIMVKPKIPGRGLGIAGMVLGIIGLVYSTILCMGASIMVDAVETAKKQFRFVDASTDGIEGIVPAIMMLLIMNILALCFGASAHKQDYRTGVQKSGVIMGIVGILLNVISLALIAPYL